VQASRRVIIARDCLRQVIKCVKPLAYRVDANAPRAAERGDDGLDASGQRWIAAAEHDDYVSGPPAPSKIDASDEVPLARRHDETISASISSLDALQIDHRISTFCCNTLQSNLCSCHITSFHL